ncbi:MAG TPA: thioredoxin domain-containing protein [Pyrinomonadaceae bacterium]|nr:thioredoxin domain-containing protein [Pyrinomonadaceae bacterium]
MQKYRPILIIGFVLAVTVAGLFFLLRARTNGEFAGTKTQSATEDKSKIPEGVVVTLEEFGDYQCPPCGGLHPSLKKMKQEFGANLNFVFRNLPLTTLHKNALAAAQAAEAARMQSHFWEMHDLLYENQDLWKDDINPKSIFVKFAEDLGLDTARFARDMDDKQVNLRIEADRSAAAELGIDGTPTILIEGRKLLPEVTNPDGIRKGIEFTLSRKKPSPS